MSESIIETVQIVSEKSDDNPNGYIVINAEDFNTDIHVLFENEQDAEQEEVESEDAPVKRGRKPRAN